MDKKVFDDAFRSLECLITHEDELQSLDCLGLDRHSFRLVHQDEMTATNLMFPRHSDGSNCYCSGECIETLYGLKSTVRVGSGF